MFNELLKSIGKVLLGMVVVLAIPIWIPLLAVSLVVCAFYKIGNNITGGK